MGLRECSKPDSSHNQSWASPERAVAADECVDETGVCVLFAERACVELLAGAEGAHCGVGFQLDSREVINILAKTKRPPVDLNKNTLDFITQGASYKQLTCAPQDFN